MDTPSQVFDIVGLREFLDPLGTAVNSVLLTGLLRLFILV